MMTVPFWRECSLLVLDKPRSVTSYDLVKRISQKVGTRVGHAGTLDPLATGVMILGIGQATKLLPCFLWETKRYIFDVVFGALTDSYDSSGAILARKKVTPTQADLREAMRRFEGTIQQRPPVFSAIKVRGIPSYKRVRRGETYVLPKRDVIIHQFFLHELQKEVARVEVLCSHGTYVRALGVDLAASLGAYAYVDNIRRLEVGPFSLSHSIALQDTAQYHIALSIQNPCLLPYFSLYTIDSQWALSKWSQGQKLPPSLYKKERSGASLHSLVAYKDDFGTLIPLGLGQCTSENNLVVHRGFDLRELQEYLPSNKGGTALV